MAILQLTSYLFYMIPPPRDLATVTRQSRSNFPSFLPVLKY